MRTRPVYSPQITLNQCITLNKREMKKILFFLICFGLLISCSKDEEATIEPKEVEISVLLK